MRYFDRQHTDHYRDHVRDLAKHSWLEAEVASQPDPDVHGLTAHIVTGYTAQDVQAAINLLMDFTDKPGEGHFDSPKKVGARWVSCGWTQFGRLA